MRRFTLIWLIWPLLLMSFSGCFLKKKAAATATTKATVTTSAGETVATTTEGYEIPTKISTIPDSSTAGAPLTGKGVKGKGLPLNKLQVLPRAIATDSDYARDGVLQTKVSEPALDQFSIIEQVMGALAQTGFNLPEILKAVADGGYRDKAYAALIAWDDDKGNGQKKIETWRVQSRMVTENGKDINRANFWIEENNDGGAMIIKGLANVYSAPTTTNKYGTWDINVSFETTTGTRVGTFVASASETTGGTVQLRVNHSQTRDNVSETVKGKLDIKATTGNGVVQYNDWDSCTSWPCTPALKTSRYSYNADHVIIKNGDAEAKCKNRNSSTDIYMDYNVYTAEGKNLKKEKNFSFPLKGSGDGAWYFYNGWQGRQQLHGNGASDLALGTTLTRADYFGSGTAPTYTIAKRYSGYLVKKTLISINLSDLKGEVYESNTHQNFCLKYTSGSWKKYSHDCTSNPVDYTSSLSGLNPTEGSRTWVDIRNMDSNWARTTYSELATNGTRYMVNISAPLYLSYDGTDWTNYTADYSSDQWNPTLTAAGTYTDFEANKTLYMRTKSGLNYLLTINNSGTPSSAQKETQSVVKPGTADATANTTFTDDQDNSYTWDSSTMLLASNGVTKTQPVWRLSGDTDNANYTWEYAEPGQGWGTLTYLNDSNSQNVLLDDPIFFDDVANITVNGTATTISGLAYDGHLSGVPDVWQMLQKNRESGDKEAGLTSAQKARVVNIPAGTEITSAGHTYLIKPRFGFKILDAVASGSCTVSLDTSLNLEGLPSFTEHKMGAVPTTSGVVVSEGVFLKTN